MPTPIQQLTAMCRDGRIDEAYQLAQADQQAMPDYPWIQSGVAWVLYYKLKREAESGDFIKMTDVLDEIKSLELLTVENDAMVFDNVQFAIAKYVKDHIPENDNASPAKLSALFQKLKPYKFGSSKAHSFLLQVFLKFDAWSDFVDFVEWWDLDNLSDEDHRPFKTSEGRQIMSLAERAHIAYSKALLGQTDLGRVEEFLPKLDNLMDAHPEMMYPGYFYGKLLLKLGRGADETLAVIVPFVRKKASEFWAWQLLSEIFVNDAQKRLACLLRASHCRAHEEFIGKIRMKLAKIFIETGQQSRAKYQIDKFTRCYIQHGWHIPYEVECWVHQPWMTTAIPDSSDPIDYMGLTNEILCNGAEECIAVITHVDQASHKASFVYGHEKRNSQRLNCRVKAGDVLKMHYVTAGDGRINVLFSSKIQLQDDVEYAKIVEGTISKRDGQSFAFLRSGSKRAFVSPGLVQANHLNDSQSVKALIVYDFNRARDAWNWSCAKIINH